MTLGVVGERVEVTVDRRPLVERCVCGGSILALSVEADDIVLAVRAHQQELIHRAWRTRQGLG